MVVEKAPDWKSPSECGTHTAAPLRLCASLGNRHPSVSKLWGPRSPMTRSQPSVGGLPMSLPRLLAANTDSPDMSCLLENSALLDSGSLLAGPLVRCRCQAFGATLGRSSTHPGPKQAQGSPKICPTAEPTNVQCTTLCLPRPLHQAAHSRPFLQRTGPHHFCLSLLRLL